MKAEKYKNKEHEKGRKTEHEKKKDTEQQTLLLSEVSQKQSNIIELSYKETKQHNGKI